MAAGRVVADRVAGGHRRSRGWESCSQWDRQKSVLLEGPRFRSCHAPGGVGDGSAIATRGVYRSSAACLSRTDPILFWLKCLSWRQIELVHERRWRNSNTLGHLRAHGVELPVNAESCGASNDDRDRQRRNGRCVAYTNLFLIEEGTVFGDLRRDRNAGHVDSERSDARQAPAIPGDGHIDHARRDRARDCYGGDAAIPCGGRRVESDTDAVGQDDGGQRFKSVQCHGAGEAAAARYRYGSRRARARIDRQARRVNRQRKVSLRRGMRVEVDEQDRRRQH